MSQRVKELIEKAEGRDSTAGVLYHTLEAVKVISSEVDTLQREMEHLAQHRHVAAGDMFFRDPADPTSIPEKLKVSAAEARAAIDVALSSNKKPAADEAFLHAACLSIAERRAGWSIPRDWDSPATRAVRGLALGLERMEKDRDEARERRDKALETAAMALKERDQERARGAGLADTVRQFLSYGGLNHLRDALGAFDRGSAAEMKPMSGPSSGPGHDCGRDRCGHDPT